MAACELFPDGTSSDVARCELRAIDTCEKALADFVDEDSSFAANQRHRTSRAFERCRMKLDELQIS
ncbi:hypothetical protein ACVIN2_002973 [Bradyrhizobium sp. USDA 3650]